MGVLVYWSIGLGLTRPRVQIDAAKMAELAGYSRTAAPANTAFSVLRRKLLGDYNETPRTPRSGRILNNADNLPPGHIAGDDFNTPEEIAPLLAPLGETQRSDP